MIHSQSITEILILTKMLVYLFKEFFIDLNSLSRTANTKDVRETFGRQIGIEESSVKEYNG